jgi:hypothetical protein
LEERVGAGLALAPVERVVDYRIGSTGVHLLERGVGSTAGASNESNDTNYNAGNDTSSEGRNDDRGGWNWANSFALDALLLLFFALGGRAVIGVISCGNVAIERLLVAALEGDANRLSAIETIVGAREVLTKAAKSIVAGRDLARVREIADHVAGDIIAKTSDGVASVNGAANSVVAALGESLASTSHVVASRRRALVSVGSAINRIVDASAVRSITRVNGASIVIVTISGSEDTA